MVAVARVALILPSVSLIYEIYLLPVAAATPTAETSRVYNAAKRALPVVAMLSSVEEYEFVNFVVPYKPVVAFVNSNSLEATPSTVTLIFCDALDVAAVLVARVVLTLTKAGAAEPLPISAVLAAPAAVLASVLAALA